MYTLKKKNEIQQRAILLVNNIILIPIVISIIIIIECNSSFALPLQFLFCRRREIKRIVPVGCLLCRCVICSLLILFDLIRKFLSISHCHFLQLQQLGIDFWENWVVYAHTVDITSSQIWHNTFQLWRHFQVLFSPFLSLPPYFFCLEFLKASHISSIDMDKIRQKRILHIFSYGWTL